MTPLTTKELAKKLYFKRPHWLKGAPIAIVTGDEKRIGKVTFRFPDGDYVDFGIYLFDKKMIAQMAEEVIDNFSDIINEWFRESYNDNH